jgi:hypothetical protein
MIQIDTYQKKKWTANKYMKMLNIISYQGNANQNYSKSPCHPS